MSIDVRKVLADKAAEKNPFATPTQPMDRDRYGRPLIVPPDGGKPTAYTRVTTLAGTLDDTFGLGKWQRRMTALGLASRPDLLLAVQAAEDGDSRTIDRAVEDAMEAAGSSAKATIGTALHTLTERLDLGHELPAVAPEHETSLKAYMKATSHLEMLAVEQFVVIDELQVAGTFDRLVGLDGGRFIGDLKTGKIRYGLGKIAMQLALYAHGSLYDPATGERTPLNVDRRNGLIIHLPAGVPSCQLWWVDIASGWEAVQMAVDVRAWRKRRDLSAPAGDEVIV